MNTAATIVWRTKYAAAYMEEENMVIRYRFPFSKQREAALLGAYKLSPKERLPYYQNLSAMIERSISVSEYLKEERVPSILFYDHTFQKQEKNGIICIYCIPEEPVIPLSCSLFNKDCNALTSLDVFLRLTHILRDINKTPIPLVLRYMDMDEVFLTNDNRIKLGGFFYAMADGLTQAPYYLQDAAPIIPAEVRDGEIGNIGTDMKALSMIAWNVFSGLPWNCGQTTQSMQIPPAYAPPALLRVLELGLSGDPDQFNAFRKQLLQCRKELAKTDFAQIIIPMGRAMKKQYSFSFSHPISL